MAEYCSLLPADGQSILLEKHDIRRQLLLFDKILLFHDFEIYKRMESEIMIIAELAGYDTFHYMKGFYRDMEQLWEIGKAEQIIINLQELAADKEALKSKEKYLYHKQAYDSVFDHLDELSEDEFERSAYHGLLASSLENRITAAYANKQSKNKKIIPLISRLDNQSNENKTEMLLITLKKLPIIDETVPINIVAEYKNSEKNILEYYKLLDWLNTFNTESFNPIEFDDKIKFLMLEYENNLKLHKMKYSYTTLQTLISCSAGFIENLVKINIKSAFDTFFDIKKQEIELLQQEKLLPGSEVSYLVSSNSKF